MQWVEYVSATKRLHKETVPTSNITAEAVVADGFVLSQKDAAGITTTQTRSYLSTSTLLTQTDGQGNTTTTRTDIAGRVFSVTDASGANTFTTYDAYTDNPAIITNALGKTTSYRYDIRGRKVAEWGSAIQPACYGYDDADRLVSLTTFRVDTETIDSDPAGRTDGDTTTWFYHDASGAETAKTYADGNGTTKTYDAFLNIATDEEHLRGVQQRWLHQQHRHLQLHALWCRHGRR